MDVFQLRESLIDDYSSFVTSFLQFRDDRIEHKVTELLADGHLRPEPRIALNPAFEPGGTVSELVADGRLHPTCAEVFRAGKADGSGDEAPGTEIRLHRHQVEAIDAARADANYVLTTGTGSGKSLAYMERARTDSEVPPVPSELESHGWEQSGGSEGRCGRYQMI